MREQIEFCPFCGSTSGRWASHKSTCWFRMNDECERNTESHTTKSMTIAWNTRPALDGDKELVEALEGIVETDYIEGYEGCISMATEALKKYKENQ